MLRSIVFGSDNGKRGAARGVVVVALVILSWVGARSLRRIMGRAADGTASLEEDYEETERGTSSAGRLLRAVKDRGGGFPAARVGGGTGHSAADRENLPPTGPEDTVSASAGTATTATPEASSGPHIAPDWRAARRRRAQATAPTATAGPGSTTEPTEERLAADRDDRDGTDRGRPATPGPATDSYTSTTAGVTVTEPARDVGLTADAYLAADARIADAESAVTALGAAAHPVGATATFAVYPAAEGGTDSEFPVADARAAAMAAEARPGFFYGWILVAAVFIILAVSSGIGFYNASVILAAASDELDASVGSVSGATGLFFAIGGLTGFLFAKRMDTVDIRWFFLAGGLVGAVALIGLRWVTTVGGLYVFFGLFGVGFSLAGLVPATTLVTRWFDRRRSVALSIASTGLSMGGIVVTPISAWLIEQRTLSGASPYLAAIWVVGIIPIALLLVRSYPSDKGLVPDGGRASVTAPAELRSPRRSGRGQARAGGPAVAGMEFAAARSTRFFIALCFAYAVIFFGQVGAIAQLFNMVLERSDNNTAKTALSVLALTSVIARLAGGAVVLRIPTKAFSAMLAVLQAVALVLLASANSSITLILTSAFLGISIGNLLMLQPLLLAEAFGVAHYGRIYSFNQLFGTIGVAGGPLALGVLRDLYDYRIAFLVAAAASFTGFVFIVVAGPTKAIQERWQVPSSPQVAGRYTIGTDV